MSSTTTRRGSPWRAVLTVLALVLLVAVVALIGLRGGTVASQAPGPAAQTPPRATAHATVAPSGRAIATATAPAALGATSRPTAAPASAPAPAKPAAPSGPAEVDRERIAREATWTPGQLQAHFEKHGREGPWSSEADFDASARETIRIGTLFTYVDRESNAERLGFYHRESNRFVSVTRDGRRITTQFKPDRGEAYVRGLTRSTYR
jgi:pyocin large subunit-like protein